MTLEHYSKEYILTDVAKLQYLYKLKEVTRYNNPREHTDNTESVAEHLYGMQLLAQYFLPLEDPDKTLNWERVYELITIHDFDEIITGDYISYIKTDAHKSEAKEALPQVLNQVPKHIKEKVVALAEEYETQSSAEARFTKAIDKVEPLLQIYSEKWKPINLINNCTPSNSLRTKSAYIEHFPYIKKFASVLHEAAIAGGYYAPE